MRQALLIVDMVNHFDFPGGAALLRQLEVERLAIGLRPWPRRSAC